MSLGNQLNGVRLVDEGLQARFKAAYPEVEVQPQSQPRASTMEVDPVWLSCGVRSQEVNQSPHQHSLQMSEIQRQPMCLKRNQ